jgi:5-formyltetrahydrofolate cyclo-ligase
VEKKKARAEIKRRIKALTPHQRSEKSSRIAQRVVRLPEFLEANTVMLFVSLKDETDTMAIVRAALEAGKTVLMPKVFAEEARMAACPIADVDELKLGAFGIPEPAVETYVPPEEIDFCLVPARAFDRLGARLGRGAGYYDRFMSDGAFRAFCCGIAFSEQILEEVPVDCHDLPVKAIVTDAETIRLPR